MPDKAGLVFDKIIKSKFDRFYLEEMNQTKIGNNGLDHNKLRLYKTLKGSFQTEPYVNNIKNINQRHWLSRYRTSAHTLCVESGRFSSPVTPLSERKCIFLSEWNMK